MGPFNLNLPALSSSPIPKSLELKDQVLLRETQHDDHVSCQYLDKNPSYYSHKSSLPIELSSHAQDLKVESAVFCGKSNDFGQLLPSSSSSCPQNNGHDSGFHHGSKPMSNHKELGDTGIIGIMNNIDQKNPKKWKSSKVRIMQKMMGTSKRLDKGEDHHNKLQRNLEQGQHSLCKNNKNSSNSNGVIRVCSDCHTTTTPLWRSGPQGPKTKESEKGSNGGGSSNSNNRNFRRQWNFSTNCTYQTIKT
uniref:GATA-type domain-containing protein n=1 Tax=Opuntia streptacantha TaxID=393608 RepID=A0A7C8YP47_OPUST